VLNILSISDHRMVLAKVICLANPKLTIRINSQIMKCF